MPGHELGGGHDTRRKPPPTKPILIYKSGRGGTKVTSTGFIAQRNVPINIPLGGLGNIGNRYVVPLTALVVTNSDRFLPIVC